MTTPDQQPQGPFGPAAIAAHWTANGLPASRQYADKCVKKLGCPNHSLEAALEWRTARTANRTTGKGGKQGGAEAPAPVVSFTPAGVNGDSLDAMLDRVRGTEVAAFVRWSSAKGYDQAAEAKAYTEAARTRATVESLVAAHRKKVGRDVDLALAQQLIDSRLAPLRSALHGLDKELAREFFPEDPAKYRPRFRRVIARAVVASLAVARAKKPLLAPLHDAGTNRAA